MTQIYETKSNRKGYSGFSAEELTARLDDVLTTIEAGNQIFEEQARKNSDQYKVKMPLQSEQETTLDLMNAIEKDPRRVPVDEKAHGIRKDLINDLKKQNVQQTNWNEIGKKELAVIGIESSQWNTQKPRWFEEEVED